jgi:site-specific recombinase XerD
MSLRRGPDGLRQFETELAATGLVGDDNDFARMIERAGIEAKFGFKPHPHMLRHACGYALANRGHDTRALQAYLGHKNIQHTVRYTELSPTRFKNFWRE